LRERVIALVAAYAIALASLIASFSAAQATAGPIDGANLAICHGLGEAAPATGSHQGSGDICLKTCIGCMTSLATIIPPTVAAADPSLVSFKRLDLPALSVRLAGAKSNAHRSRGPPPAL
jgi:hypothetical protein